MLTLGYKPPANKYKKRVVRFALKGGATWATGNLIHFRLSQTCARQGNSDIAISVPSLHGLQVILEPLKPKGKRYQHTPTKPPLS